MGEDKNNIIFNISGGNNQILPNATKAEQHFYGDQFAKEALRKAVPTFRRPEDINNVVGK